MRGEYSLADIAAATGNGNGEMGNNAFDNPLWALIFLAFLGNNDGNGIFGGGNKGNGGSMDGYILTSDFANIERKLDGVNNGICDSTFALNNTMTNGFAGVQQTLSQGFAGVNQGIVTSGYETRIGINGIGTQLASCCCDIREAIQGVNFNQAQNTCAITNALAMNTRDIIDNQNANYRALHDELVANRIEQKDLRIAELSAQVAKADDMATAQYIINKVKGCPEPAYIVPNPNCCYNYTVSQNSCGCNCGNY